MTSSGPVLRASSVSKRFRGVLALDDASLELFEGEVLGVIGPNGAGKTTLFNVIAGAFRPTSGRVEFRGRDITRLPANRRVRLGVSRTFQLMKPFVSMSVYDNVVVAATGSGLSSRAARVRADEVITRLQMHPIAARSGGEINAVQAKRLELARALAAEPARAMLPSVVKREM